MNRTDNRVRRSLGAAAAALVALGAAVLLGAPAQAHGAHHVEIKQYMYMPMSLKVEQGDTVTWTNEDTVEHDVAVTSGPVSFTSPMLAKGKSWSHTFTVAGPYSYLCSVHPDMKATITVTAAPVATKAASPQAPVTAATTAPKASATKAPRAAGAAGARSSAVAAPAVETATTTTASAPASSATLQPLLLVVGASVAAMMFCLLLMAARPVTATGEGEEPAVQEEPKPGRRRLDE